MSAALAVSVSVCEAKTSEWQTLIDVASKAASTKHYVEAERDAQRALKLAESFDSGDPRLEETLRVLGGIFSSQGKHAQAVPLFQRLVAVTETTYGDDHEQVALSLKSLLDAGARAGKHEQDEAVCKRILTIDRKEFGENHSEVAEDLCLMGNVYFNQKRYPESEEAYKRALQIRQYLIPVNKATVAKNLAILGELYFEQGKFDQAENAYGKSLQNWKNCPRAAYETASAAYCLGRVKIRQKKYAEAEPLLLMARRNFGSFASSDDNLSLLKELIASYDERKMYLEEQPIIEAAIRVFDKSGDTTAKGLWLCSLAINLIEQRKYPEAAQTVAKAEAIFDKLLISKDVSTSKDSKEAAYWLNRVGVCYWRKNHNQEALQVFERVIKLDGKFGQAFANRSTVKKEMGDILGSIWDLGIAKSLGCKGNN